MRALRRPGQPIDPKIYSDYYVLVEKIFGLYRDYQVAYQEKVISMKDDKIDTLLKEVAEQKLMIGEQRKEVAEQTKLIVIQSKENADQKEMIARQTQKVDKLLVYAEDITEKLDRHIHFTSTLCRFTLSNWIGGTVFKTQVEQLIAGHDLAYALSHLKVMYTVAFYTVGGNRSDMVIYFCCTNFADVCKRIREIYKRHSEEGFAMMKPMAICLISQEINYERAKIQQLAFAKNEDVVYNNRRKSFHVTVETTSVEELHQMYDVVVAAVRAENFQGYQVRRDRIMANEEYQLHESILQHMLNTDVDFFSSTLPRCQEYIDYCTTRDAASYKPVKTISRRVVHRDDLNEVGYWKVRRRRLLGVWKK